MMYHAYIIYLFTPLRQSASELDPNTRDQVDYINKDAALEIVRVVRLQQAAYGTSHMCFVLFVGILPALEVLIGRDDHTAYESELLDLFVHLRAMSRRFPVVMSALRMVRLRAKQAGKVLPFAAEKLFEDFEARDWREHEMKRIASQFPVMWDKANGHGKQTLTDFFDAMEKLEVKDKDESVENGVEPGQQ